MFWLRNKKIVLNRDSYLGAQDFGFKITVGNSRLPCWKKNKNLGVKIVNISLSISLNICFGCSKEPSNWDGCFEYPKHMFWLRNKKVEFKIGILICFPVGRKTKFGA